MLASAVALLILDYRLVTPDDASEQRMQAVSVRPNIVFVMTDDIPKGLWKSMTSLISRLRALERGAGAPAAKPRAEPQS